MMLEIVNLVATAELKQPIELQKISTIEYVIHDQEIYGGRVAYLKTPDMHGKVTIFPSGKMISVGSKSPKQAQEDLDFTVNYLTRASIIKPVKVKARTRNIVAIQHLEKAIDLESFSLIKDCIYEPEQFPGLILRQANPKVTYLVFSSGKVVIAGSKSLDELGLAAINLQKIIQELD